MQLTEKGRELIDTALVDHLATQRSILAVLTHDEIEQLDAALSKLLRAAEER
ncbi:hypothetical protein [Boseongicola sp. H5]|uniref:hypothetical protein n=1 Tax=Boseongicola sp. H5 TaxID=2763261 RepID=UPI00336AD6AB